MTAIVPCGHVTCLDYLCSEEAPVKLLIVHGADVKSLVLLTFIKL